MLLLVMQNRVIRNGLDRHVHQIQVDGTGRWHKVVCGYCGTAVLRYCLTYFADQTLGINQQTQVVSDI